MYLTKSIPILANFFTEIYSQSFQGFCHKPAERQALKKDFSFCNGDEFFFRIERSPVHKDVESLQRLSGESVDNTRCCKSFYHTFR